jgi:molybdenum cofactor guanylyltransferase
MLGSCAVSDRAPPTVWPAMVTLAIQAGGRSSRMGRDKGLVELAGKPLIRHILDRLAPLAGDLLITTNDPAAYSAFGARTAADERPGAGALDGLWTALEAAEGDPVLVVACDMPFASRRLAAHLLALSAGAEAVVPRPGGEFEPLFAAYRRSCAVAIRRALDTGQRRVISFFPDVRLRLVEADEVERIDPDPWSFFNVNTPDELAKAEQHLRSAAAEENP